jgi:thiosulfate/3-mercaptopyruvate sulfurtransferase
MADPMISVVALEDRLASGSVRLVDATWFLPDSGRDAWAEYMAGHLPGAVFFDIDAVADRESGLPHMLPSQADFAAALGRLGLVGADEVVVYDRPPIPSAARVWWMLRVFGHEAVRVLDGGLEGWVAAGGRLEQGAPAPCETVYVARAARPELVRDYEETRLALQSGAAQLLDARPAARFRGEAPEPRPGLGSGHAPGALNLPVSSVYGPDGRLRPESELAELFTAAGVNVRQPVIASCGSGVTAGSLALALARLGQPDTPVYDGSWAEWGARADAPVVQGG